MQIDQIKLISKHTYRGILNAPINRWLIGVFLALIGIALAAASLSHRQHQHDVEHYSNDVRDRWENSPDKHPHRMAHYGYVAFRSKAPLSFFDRGLDSYLGNAVFLEAHRQNAVNFSTASQSTGLLRFGELSAGLLLQLLLPLLIFFWGFASVADERDGGILKIYLAQGVGWKEILLGKSLGIFCVSALITLPALLLTSLLLTASLNPAALSYSLFPLLAMGVSYLGYTLIMCLLAVTVSSRSASAKSALIKLIGCWLFFVLILPKISRVAAQFIYPSPSKIAFDSLVEDDIIQIGDSHNPNDRHFKALKDSLLRTYGVSSVKELPFNYGGFQMREGERMSTEVYRKHQSDLMDRYQRQNQVMGAMAVLNPYLAISDISMTLAGTDFASYQIFTDETEAYRYNLAQTMNNLQIEHISNNVKTSADEKAILSQQYWRDFPKFEHRLLTMSEMARSIAYPVGALLLWLIALAFGTKYLTGDLKAY